MTSIGVSRTLGAFEDFNASFLDMVEVVSDECASYNYLCKVLSG